jgi:fumarylacetoacetase
MPPEIDQTHDPKLESWVESANDPGTDFPIQNLPWCVFKGQRGLEVGARIGDMVLQVEWLFGNEEIGSLTTAEEDAALEQLIVHQGWAQFPSWHAWWHLAEQASLRNFLTRLLSAENRSLAEKFPLKHALVPASEVEFASPIPDLRDYTDFYASLHHATNVGSMFRPDNPILPNYKWIPIGYHGRASSIVPSGTAVRRPKGQLLPGATIDDGPPQFGACKLLDYELEVGAVIGRGNELGRAIPMSEAEDHIFGLCLVNDWSARDIQKWEYQPLGPFLAKSFATTISPYIVTMEALAPFRTPAFARAEGDPQPLAYLDSEQNRAAGGFDITLEVYLQSEQMRARGMEPIRSPAAASRTCTGRWARWWPTTAPTGATCSRATCSPAAPSAGRRAAPAAACWNSRGMAIRGGRSQRAGR